MCVELQNQKKVFIRLEEVPVKPLISYIIIIIIIYTLFGINAPRGQ